MPYLHLDTYESNELRSKTVKWISKDRRDISKKPSIPVNGPAYIDSLLIARYLDHGAHCHGSLHVRRSLDQYYYDTQDDTDERDKDQIVYKYTKSHGLDLVKKKKAVVMMVDQMWLWVLEDANIREFRFILILIKTAENSSNCRHMFPERFQEG
jgi:hypothetical protein